MMTRPPAAASYAQFFPAAPKVKAQAQDRVDRERSKSRSKGPDSVSEAPSTLIQEPDVNLSAPCEQNGLASDAPLTHVDDNESPSTDLISTIGSASSHSSSASSVFSTSARVASTAASLRLPTTSVTPLASKDSPSYLAPPTSSKPEMSPSLVADPASTPESQIPSATDRNGAISNGVAAIERVPARDPMPSIKGIKCTYDPLLDRVHNKSVSRNAKPTYKEFGLVCTVISSLFRGGVISCESSWLTVWTGR